MSEEMDRIVYQYLKRRGYTNTQRQFEQETPVRSLDQLVSNLDPASVESGIANQIAVHVTDDTRPEKVEEAYTGLNKWIGNSLDQYRNELYTVMYPIFVHCYLDLIARGHVEEGKRFMSEHSVEHIQYHRSEVESLKAVVSPDLLASSEIVNMFRVHKYNLRMCSYSFELLFAFLQEKNYRGLLRILNQHVQIKTLAGKPSQRIDVGGITGSSFEEASQMNKKRVYWGTFDVVDEEEMVEEEVLEADGTKQIRTRSIKKSRFSHPNAPEATQRLKIPAIKGADLEMRLAALKDAKRRVALGATALPSACIYTYFNAHELICLNMSVDCSMMAGGFGDSIIKVWSLNGKGLVALRPHSDIKSLPADASRSELFDESTRSMWKELVGHSGPVYSVSFSPDNLFLISASADSTVRLWSLATFTNVVVYKGHSFPVWDVCFSPLGLYFATASHDRTARLWNTENIHPLRIFAGHLSDVDSVRFHPNGNYIATGSSDKSCRLWDVQTGECVRVFQGHRDTINALAFSHEGRFLASGGEDGDVILWDIGSSKKIKTLRGHGDTIFSLCFSGEDAVLASGGADNTVRIWDCKTAFASAGDAASAEAAEAEEEEEADTGEDSAELLATFMTKSTPVYEVKFSATNVLLCSGVFSPSAD